MQSTGIQRTYPLRTAAIVPALSTPDRSTSFLSHVLALVWLGVPDGLCGIHRSKQACMLSRRHLNLAQSSLLTSEYLCLQQIRKTIIHAAAVGLRCPTGQGQESGHRTTGQQVSANARRVVAVRLLIERRLRAGESTPTHKRCKQNRDKFEEQRELAESRPRPSALRKGSNDAKQHRRIADGTQTIRRAGPL